VLLTVPLLSENVWAQWVIGYLTKHSSNFFNELTRVVLYVMNVLDKLMFMFWQTYLGLECAQTGKSFIGI
jgi:hypothetical protein